MNSNQTINRSNSRKHYHEQSMDDFMKNIKKFNLRSQRYISPKPLLYMYAKNNTTNTIQKSRSKTLSNCKSNHSKSKRSKKDKDKQKQGKSSVKYIKSKLDKIFQKKDNSSNRDVSSVHLPQNPAILIEKCGQKIKKAEKYLQNKNAIGSYLCQEFLQILNDIVQKMVKQLDKQLKQLQNKTEKQIERKFVSRLKKNEKINKKLNKIIEEMSVKAENNSRLLYELRKKCQIDIDYLFGKAVLGTEKCGGVGYSKNTNHNDQYQMESFQPQQPDEIEQYENIIRKNQQFLRETENKHNLRLDLKKQIERNLDFTQRQKEKESGRIRQAYDWQREAYDAGEKQKRKFNMVPKQFVTFLENQNESQFRQDEDQYQEQQGYDDQFQTRIKFARKST